ncbi:hypothetical protein PoB_003092900 [Plakobranchus ocellatus]|uniref:Uncharacterized protein n=1 Tax=Plakobranchus ocellatus TaxID=259542 RepID=A0AAV4ADV0_9GAST|nr:hypothetical protein PoB_003092900 [Plakobranchus ocellatus]
MASPEQNDLRLPGHRRVPLDLKADSLCTVPPKHRARRKSLGNHGELRDSSWLDRRYQLISDMRDSIWRRGKNRQTCDRRINHNLSCRMNSHSARGGGVRRQLYGRKGQQKVGRIHFLQQTSKVNFYEFPLYRQP